MAILGSAVLRNFYTVWDMDNLRIGIAPLKGSSYIKPIPEWARLPVTEIKNFDGFTIIVGNISGWYVFLMTLIGPAIVTVISVLLYYFVILRDKKAPPGTIGPALNMKAAEKSLTK